MEQREQTTITDLATGQSETTVSLIVLKETNVWETTQSATLPTPVLAVLVAAVVVVVGVPAVLYGYKRRKKSP